MIFSTQAMKSWPEHIGILEYLIMFESDGQIFNSDYYC